MCQGSGTSYSGGGFENRIWGAWPTAVDTYTSHFLGARQPERTDCLVFFPPAKSRLWGNPWQEQRVSSLDDQKGLYKGDDRTCGGWGTSFIHPAVTCWMLSMCQNLDQALCEWNRQIACSHGSCSWMRRKHQPNTVDPWTTRVWTAQVYLYADFFCFLQTLQYTTTRVGWICWCRTADREGRLKVIHGFSAMQRVSTPNPPVIGGSAVLMPMNIKPVLV